MGGDGDAIMSSVSDTGPEGAWRRRGGCGAAGWRPVEVLAVVLGFMVYWPIGLGLIGWKMMQRRGRLDMNADWFGSLRQKMEGFAGGMGSANPSARAGVNGFGFSARSGNAAFDEWRKAEIERLEEERRKLEAAQREFDDFVAEARKARDREEFERFMRGRSTPQG
jgi:hypothetical protein